MMNENKTKEPRSLDSIRSTSPTPISIAAKLPTVAQTTSRTGGPPKEKNPKRIAAGKKGVEARKIKAELKKKESELLMKENIELKERKQITRGGGPGVSVANGIRLEARPEVVAPPVLKDDAETFITDKIDKNYNLIYLTIGVVGLGLYFYHKPSLKNLANERALPLKNVTPVIPVVPVVSKKKEIDPFDF